MRRCRWSRAPGVAAAALVERRAAPGSRIGEIRVTAHSPLAPAAVFETSWKHQEYLQFVPYLKRLKLLSDTGDERVAGEVGPPNPGPTARGPWSATR